MTAPVLDGIGSLQEQVRRLIFREISDGTYAPGTQLPTERDYAETLGVSLITVRTALASLVQAGHIERSSGRGTFVRQTKVAYQIRLMASTTVSLRAANVRFRIRVLEAGLQPPPATVRRELRLGTNTAAFRLLRVAEINDAPAILLESWLRRSIARRIANDESVTAGGSLYAALAEHGVVLSHAEGRLELEYASEDEARHLRRAFGAPLFAYTSTTTDDNGRVVESARALYDADRFAITISREVTA